MNKFISIKKVTQEKRRRDVTRCRFLLKIGSKSWHITLAELVTMRDDASDLIRAENLRTASKCKLSAKGDK